MIKPPIFVGGAGRSGTTLLRLFLDSHPNITCGPEMKFVPMLCRAFTELDRIHGERLANNFNLARSDNAKIFGQHIVATMEPYRVASGKPRIAEKTPQNIFQFEILRQVLSDSPLIQVLRDGRDVVRSLLSMNWFNLASGKPLPYTVDIEAAANYWVRSVESGRKLLRQENSNYFEIRFEDLVERPEFALKQLFDFVGEPWSDAVLDYADADHHLSIEDYNSQGEVPVRPVDRTRSGKWREEWSVSETDIVRRVAGDLLVNLGYSDGEDW